MPVFVSEFPYPLYPLGIGGEFMSVPNEIEYMRRCLEKYYKEYFLYKSEEWMSEHEFRWLVRSQDPSEEILVSIETALKAVIVGEAFSEVYIPSVNVLCDKLKLPVYKITWLDGKPKVEKLSAGT